MDNKRDDPEKLLEGYKQCDAFFKKVIDEASGNQHLNISDDTAFYLMGILVRGIIKDPTNEPDSLGEKYLLAKHNSNKEGEFKEIGDSSLMIAGIWWQSLLRKLVDVDYYIEIGKRAYRGAGENTSKNISEIFEELADNFKDIANVLTEATRCIYEKNIDNTSILRLYEFWQKTHNPFIEKKLRELGINPVYVKISKH